METEPKPKKFNFRHAYDKLRMIAFFQKTLVVYMQCKGICISPLTEFDTIIIIDSKAISMSDRLCTLAHEVGHAFKVKKVNEQTSLIKRKKLSSEEVANQTAIKILEVLGVPHPKTTYDAFYKKELDRLENKPFDMW